MRQRALEAGENDGTEGDAATTTPEELTRKMGGELRLARADLDSLENFVERGLGEIREAFIEKGQVILEVDVGELLTKRVPLDDVVTIHSTRTIDPDESGTPFV